MTHTKQWSTALSDGPYGTVRVRVPIPPPPPRGRMIWNSDKNGTYVRRKDPTIGYPKRKRSIRKLLRRLRNRLEVPLG